MNNGLRIKGGRFLTRGFTLTELLVVVGIMTIMNLLIFANYPEFSQRLALKRTSEDVALIVRQAQAYSLGIKKPVSGDYSGFGVHFDKKNNTNLILFADTNTNTNKTYDEGELFQEYKINTGDSISGLEVCDSYNKCSEAENTLDVFYPRASPMATISIDGKEEEGISYAKITIMPPKKKNKTRIIEIWTSGQISVKEGI